MSTVRIAGVPQTRYVRPGDNLDGIAVHASPQAIAIHLDNARTQARRWARLAERLERMLADREDQIAAGQWPPKPNKREGEEQ